MSKSDTMLQCQSATAAPSDGPASDLGSQNFQPNLLISRLADDDLAALSQHLTVVKFGLGQVLSEPGEEVGYIHFVDHGIISAVSVLENGETVEAYMVGREGFTGVTAWLVPFRSSVRFVAQLAGSARRIEARRLRDLAGCRPGLRTVLATYAATLQVELEQAAPCNAVHKAVQRYAKWLLRSHDRSDGDTLCMTQEFLANLLGAQRTTVNEAAQALASAGAITYSRGKVRIVDRLALERSACECYATARLVAVPQADATPSPIP